MDDEIERRQAEVARKHGFDLRGHSLALYADCVKPNCPHRGSGTGGKGGAHG
jgi:Fur family ferric uptake transcriptional regulator